MFIAVQIILFKQSTPGGAVQLDRSCLDQVRSEAAVNSLRRATMSFVITPNSCRKRFSVVLRQTVIHRTQSLRSDIRKVLWRLYVKSQKLKRCFFNRSGAR